jgi:2-phospho-L-lactate guanylyltransferase
MPTAAVLPIKRFEAAKQRLGDELGAGTRAALAAAMFADVLSSLQHAESLEAIIVISGEPQVHDIASESGLIAISDHHDKGQSHAVRSGLARAAALGCDRAIMVSGDCPLLDPAELDKLITDATADVVIVPDRHQSGTNGLIINPSGPFEPQFGPDSLARHSQQAERRELSMAIAPIGSMAIDIDTPDDLAELARRLKDSHGSAPRTRGVLRQIERLGGSRQVAA